MPFVCFFNARFAGARFLSPALLCTKCLIALPRHDAIWLPHAPWMGALYLKINPYSQAFNRLKHSQNHRLLNHLLKTHPARAPLLKDLTQAAAAKHLLLPVPHTAKRTFAMHGGLPITLSLTLKNFLVTEARTPAEVYFSYLPDFDKLNGAQAQRSQFERASETRNEFGDWAETLPLENYASVLLIDDFITTGNTLNQLRAALHDRAPWLTIRALAFAYRPRHKMALP